MVKPSDCERGLSAGLRYAYPSTGPMLATVEKEATTCAACPSTLVTRVELLGGVCQECLEAEARRHRDETGGWVAPNVRDLQKRVLDRVAKAGR